MTFEDIHAEEARATDHDTNPAELAGLAPPCTDCGKRERAANSKLCPECQPD